VVRFHNWGLNLKIVTEQDNIIYGLKDPRTDEYRYIGKSTVGIKRAKSHLSHSHNPLVMEWISELKHDNYIPDVVILENVVDWTQLVDKEKYWIGKLLGESHDLFNVMITKAYDSNIQKYNDKVKQQIEYRNRLLEEKLEKSKIQFIVGSDVGGFIRLRRKQLKVKQEDLAEIAGISERTLRSIEKNKANPTIDTLTKLLDVLGYEIFINLK
jgi:DNA-binding XRE family transcriptional regulator